MKNALDGVELAYPCQMGYNRSQYISQIMCNKRHLVVFQCNLFLSLGILYF